VKRNLIKNISVSYKSHEEILNANDNIAVRSLSSGISQPARTYFMGYLLG
jgi:hypothetical protein